MNLKKRIPEHEEEMDNEKEVIKYFLAHKKQRDTRWDIYDLVSRDIIKNVSVKKGNALDVGCGYGGLTNRLKFYRKKLDFIGIDLSKTMIKVAKKFFSSKKTKFLVMPAKRMDFKDETFELIVCKDSVHHFKNPVKVFKEMYRALKKGGFIYVTDLNRNAPQDTIYRVIQGASGLNIENAILYIDSVKASYTIQEVKKILRKAGIRKYRLFTPKIGKNFLKTYNIKNEYFLSASDYRKDKWVLIINKPTN